MSPTPQLYVTLEIGSEPSANKALDAVLSSVSPASVLLRPKAGQPLDAGLAKSLVAAAQKRGVAALIADDANLARLIKADGVHLMWSKDIVKAYSEAREHLGERALIGADAGRSRDDAMQLGETGADYVAFGIPPHVEDRATAEGRQRDLIGWWSEIFEIPCVAFDVTDPEAASGLASEGADFIAVTVSAAQPADDIARTLSAFQAAITPTGATA